MPEKAIENKNKNTKRGLKVAAIAGGLVLVGGVAFAYWTQGGAGNGSASTGDVNGITINQTSSISGLYPGGPAATLSGTFTNSNSSKVFVEQVSVTVHPGWSSQSDTGKPACTAADFALVQPAATHQEVVTGDLWGGGSIALLDGAGNQDNCKGVTVPLDYSSN
jgi:hypothetical protein